MTTLGYQRLRRHGQTWYGMEVLYLAKLCIIRLVVGTQETPNHEVESQEHLFFKCPYCLAMEDDRNIALDVARDYHI